MALLMCSDTHCSGCPNCGWVVLPFPVSLDGLPLLWVDGTPFPYIFGWVVPIVGEQ